MNKDIPCGRATTMLEWYSSAYHVNDAIYFFQPTANIIDTTRPTRMNLNVGEMVVGEASERSWIENFTIFHFLYDSVVVAALNTIRERKKGFNSRRRSNKRFPPCAIVLKVGIVENTKIIFFQLPPFNPLLDTALSQRPSSRLQNSHSMNVFRDITLERRARS